MISTSSEYKAQIKMLGRNPLKSKAAITFSDGTILNIDDSRIRMGGMMFDDKTSSSGTLEVGCAAIQELELWLDNSDDYFSDYDFSGAVIIPQVGLPMQDGTTEWITRGKFTVYDPISKGSIITVVALDNMGKFDRAYTTNLSFPATLLQVLQDVCTTCGVSLASNTLSFPNSTYIVTQKPSTENTNCREIVAYCAQLAASYAKINNLGELYFGWYKTDFLVEETSLDGGNFIDPSSGGTADGGDFIHYNNKPNYDGGLFKVPTGYAPTLDNITNATISTDDVHVTGVQIVPKDDSKPTYFKGANGYVISIENNPLAQNNIDQLVANMAFRLVDFVFRPMSVDSMRDDPSIEAGDVAWVVDSKGNKYKTIISSLNLKVNSKENFKADAESEKERQSTRYSVSSKAVLSAKEQTQQQITTYDLAVQQLASTLAMSMGTFQTVDKQDNGSEIVYLHDQPTLEGSTKIWKRTADAIAVSNDGGTTWRGMDASGNIVAAVLTVIGVNADWITTGSLNANLIDVGTLTAILIQSSNYAAGTAGMKIDLNAGTMEMNGGALTIRDGNNQAVITAQGVKLTFVYSTSGPNFGFDIIGWLNNGWNFKSKASMYVYVPTGITVTKATAFVDIVSKYYDNGGVTSVPSGYYTASNIKLYINSSSSNLEWYVPEASEPLLNGDTGTQNGSFGTWNPSASSTVQRRSADITSAVTPGQRILVTLTGGADSYSTNKEITDNALAKITVVVEGFKQG